MQNKIIVLGSPQYSRPFLDVGGDIIRSNGENIPWKEAKCIVFTGGEDVDPSLYGEEKHPLTNSNIHRDKIEENIFLRASLMHIPMVGICRGSQFLTVMNGGTLHQHVEGHGIHGTHPITTMDGREIEVTSTHHQMMIPYNEALYPEDQHFTVIAHTKNRAFDGEIEPEVVWYDNSMSLAVQYHPEYMDEDSEGWEYFQELLRKYIFV